MCTPHSAVLPSAAGSFVHSLVLSYPNARLRVFSSFPFSCIACVVGSRKHTASLPCLPLVQLLVCVMIVEVRYVYPDSSSPYDIL